jgi:hypothetical protein
MNNMDLPKTTTSGFPIEREIDPNVLKFLEERKKILEICVEKFSQLASMQRGEFLTCSNNGFKTHQNTSWNRFFTYFSSKEATLNAVDTLIIDCAKAVEFVRFDFNHFKSAQDLSLRDQIKSERALLQTLSSTVSVHKVEVKSLATLEILPQIHVH